MATKRSKLELLEELYERYNKRAPDLPDPVDFLWRYDDPSDREIAGLVAAALSYGRVAQIMKSVGFVLERMNQPAKFARQPSSRSLEKAFSGFRHRFGSGAQLSALLSGARRVVNKHGSLEKCFEWSLDESDETIAPALGRFVRELRRGMKADCGHLLPVPEKGSACKRLLLYLRWMVRCDAVDPGSWSGVPASKLVVPLDVHMNRISRAMGLTRRKSADMRAALEVTDAFRAFAPDDPVRYDYALTRLGMKGDDSLHNFLDAWRGASDGR